MKKIICLLVLMMLVSGCATLSLKAKYDIGLVRVEKPKKVTERYGGKDIVSTEEKKYIYEDGLIRIIFIPTAYQINFIAENKTDYSLQIIWDECAYVDENGSSHRVIHSGIKYIDRNNPQPPSIIASKSKLTDIIYPSDYIEWSSDYYSSGWEEKPLFPTNRILGMVTTKEIENAKEDFKNTIDKFKNKEFSVVMPIKVEETINEYRFVFKIKDVQVYTAPY